MNLTAIKQLICFTGLALITHNAVANEPPCSATEHRQFHFWVGEWAVEMPDGKPAGTSKISVEQQGCVIVEQWQSATSAYSGTSFNFYDPDLKQWRQLWLDNQGGKLELFGQREGQQMILRSTANEPNTYQQITWTANSDGTVRQFWQSFTQDQEPTTLFDGLYRARTQAP